MDEPLSKANQLRMAMGHAPLEQLEPNQSHVASMHDLTATIKERMAAETLQVGDRVADEHGFDGTVVSITDYKGTSIANVEYPGGGKSSGPFDHYYKQATQTPLAQPRASSSRPDTSNAWSSEDPLPGTQSFLDRQRRLADEAKMREWAENRRDILATCIDARDSARKHSDDAERAWFWTAVLTVANIVGSALLLVRFGGWG